MHGRWGWELEPLEKGGESESRLHSNNKLILLMGPHNIHIDIGEMEMEKENHKRIICWTHKVTLSLTYWQRVTICC